MTRDVSNERGLQPLIYRRGPIRDVVFLPPEPLGISLGYGPTYGTCVHGWTWPEGDYIAPKGRACGRCVSEAHGRRWRA